MIFIFGNRLFGKVDEVPGLGHVATKYFHIDYLPLIPTEGWFVLQQNGNQWRGVRIPLSAKSVFMGWARAVSLLCGIVAPIVTIATTSNGRLELAPALLAAFAWAFFIFSKTYGGITKASYARACELARHIGLNQRGLEQLARSYGEAPPTFGFEPVAAQPSARNVDRPAAASDAGSIPLADLPGDEPAASAAIKAFFVTGFDVNTKQDACYTVHANDAEHARQLAASGGMQVRQVESAGPAVA